MPIDPIIQKSAALSFCKQYRWKLSRWWGNGPRVVFVMLTSSPPRGEGIPGIATKIFCFIEKLPIMLYSKTGLTFSPQTATASPAA
jgi:hypothetical protein